MQNLQSSTPVPRQTETPVPIDEATCISLVLEALTHARNRTRDVESRNRTGPPQSQLSDSQGSSLRPGVTIDLSHSKIASIPFEVIELIKEEIERLALAHNQLTSFPREFANLSRLRYLNLRSNLLKEIPVSLTRLASLEILDVSRNRLKTLPPDLGNLMNLKVLSMSKNKINLLPTYIGDMNDLKILKLDHNPIVFPPQDIWDSDERNRDVWLEGIKKFLRQHAERLKETQDNDTGFSGGSSDEGDGELTSFNHSLSRAASSESEAPGKHSTRAVRLSRPKGSNIESSMEVNRLSQGQSSRKNKNFGNSSTKSSNDSNISPVPTCSLTSSWPGTPLSIISTSQTERNRSNSESTVTVRDKRKGMPPPPREQVDKASKHIRHVSHDSLVSNTASHVPSKSPIDSEKRPRNYFRRLSSLPEHKRSSLSSARVGEAARGILYAMSTLQGPIEQYIQSVGGSGESYDRVERTLFDGKVDVGSLVSALEVYEENDEDKSVQKVIDACYACVAAFRQILGMLQSSTKDRFIDSNTPETRYCRTLLLLLYGSYIEIQASFEILQPLLAQVTFQDNDQIHSNILASGHPPIMNISAFTQLSAPSIELGNVQSTYIPLPTSKTGELFQTPFSLQHSLSQQSDNSFDQEDALYQKFQAATNAATSTLPKLENEIKSSASQNLQPHITLKLREASSLCISGIDAARKLSKTRWDAIQTGDVPERKKFWDETNKFTQLIINIAELIKSITHDYTFPKGTMSAVGTVVRPTKELYILMNSTTFRQIADVQPPQHPSSPHAGFVGFQSMMPATPLSAALGPAALATLPLNPFEISSNPGVFTPSSSRSGTFISNHAPTMTSAAVEVAACFSGSPSGVMHDAQSLAGFRETTGLNNVKNAYIGFDEKPT